MNSKLLIAKDLVVSINYTLRNSAKEILDQSSAEDPLLYLHGHSQIIPGLESALSGKTQGDKFSIEIAAADGYGELDDNLRIQVPKAELPAGAPIELNTVFELAGDNDHTMLARLVEINDDSVTLDANHPLAGESLFFEVEIVNVREATKEEVEHGHAHGPGGHHHH